MQSSRLVSAGPLPLFVLLGVSLVAGAVGHFLFKRHRVSDVVFLLAIGALLGPILHIIDAGVLGPALPFLAPLGLSLVLFEGGLQLSLDDIRKHAGRALGMTTLVWISTMLAVAVVMHAFVGLPWMLAFLLGMAVAATGIFVVIPLLAQLDAPGDAKVALTVETAIGDMLSAVAVTAVASMLALGATPAYGALTFATKFAFGGVVGLAAGLLWPRLLKWLAPSDHGFALTLAALIATYALAEALGGSGYLAALVFGVVLGNARAVSPGTRLHQGETVFILRSIYFVYVGLAMTAAVFTFTNALLAIILAGAMLAARAVGVFVTARGRTPQDRSTRMLLLGMMPRGLATVIVATIPATMGVPGTERFLEYTFLILVGCDIATSAMLWAWKRTAPSYWTSRTNVPS